MYKIRDICKVKFYLPPGYPPPLGGLVRRSPLHITLNITLTYLQYHILTLAHPLLVYYAIYSQNVAYWRAPHERL